MFGLLAAPLATGACNADRALAPYGLRTHAERVRVDALDAEVAGLPACPDAAPPPGEGWQTDSLTVLPGTLPLPPGFKGGVMGAPEPEHHGGRFEAAAWRPGFVRYWSRTDYAWLALEVHRGDTVVVRGVTRRADGSLPEHATPEPPCALELGGRRAWSQSWRTYAPVIRDTLFFTHVLLPASPDAVLSAYAGGHARAFRAEALAALAAARFEAPPAADIRP